MIGGLRRIGALTTLLACALALPSVLRAQMATLRVTVVDSAGEFVRGADVELRDASGNAVSSLRTDSLGSVRFGATPRAAAREIVVQRIGYLATRRRLPPGAADRIEIGLARIAIALDTVRAAGRRIESGAQRVIDSTEIGSTTRGVFDLIDVLKKLRPELMEAIGMDLRMRCLPDDIHGSLRVYVNEQFVPLDAWDVLRDVKSDAIADVRYVRCFDPMIARDDHPGSGHVYVTLRGGFAFDLKRGSFNRDTATMPVTARDTTPIVARNARVVGVFDEKTGIPIEGAKVTDLIGGNSALTTRTGTVSLAFVDTANGTLLRIERVGYAPLVLPVTNRASDPPLTLTLKPRGVASARLVRERNPADTIRKLVLTGFYDRRDTIAVAGTAFLEMPTRATLAQLSEIATTMGRPPCAANLWIDAIRVPGTLDELLAPSMILAVETYENAEVPVAYDTRPATTHCATLVWTR